MLKIFFFPGTVALASHIALAEAGADYEAVQVDFANAAQMKPEYLAVNPKGRVPALVTDRGILTETPAILLYIAQCFPDAKLAPLDDIYRLAEMQSFNNYLCATVHVNHAHRMRGLRWVEETETDAMEAMQRKVKSNMSDCFHLIEDTMFKGPWVMGADYSVADAYLFTVGRWLESDGLAIDDFPKVAAHRARMMDRKAVQRAMSEQGM